MRFHLCSLVIQHVYTKATELISITFCGGVEHDPRKNPLNFSLNPDKRADPGFFPPLLLTWRKKGIRLGGGICSPRALLV